MQGIDVRDGALGKRTSELAFEMGLVVETAGPRGEVLKVLAPLTTPEPALLEGLGILRAALRRALCELQPRL